VALVAMTACTSGGDASDPARRDDAADKVRAAIAAPNDLELVPTDPLPGEGRILCVDGQELRLYLFDTEEERAEAAELIDPADPSRVGGAIVAWSGNPVFWEVANALVLYSGSDVELLDELTSGLGEPYAAGRGRRGAETTC
jgi:hypothetical protein